MNDLHEIEITGKKVLTSKQLAKCYGTTSDIIGYNYRYNKERYVEGKHYIMLEGKALKEFKMTNVEIQRSLPRISKLYLWTEKGALLHAKSLNTDKAWEVYDYLVDFYFRAKEAPSAAVAKKTGREVVDIPENMEFQKVLKEAEEYITALKVEMKECNKYQDVERYKSHCKVLYDLSTAAMVKIMDITRMKPNITTKPGY